MPSAGAISKGQVAFKTYILLPAGISHTRGHTWFCIYFRGFCTGCVATLTLLWIYGPTSLLAVVIELVRRFGFTLPGQPLPPPHEILYVEPCTFCGFQCRKEQGHRGRHRPQCSTGFPSAFPITDEHAEGNTVKPAESKGAELGVVEDAEHGSKEETVGTMDESHEAAGTVANSDFGFVHADLIQAGVVQAGVDPTIIDGTAASLVSSNGSANLFQRIRMGDSLEKRTVIFGDAFDHLAFLQGLNSEPIELDTEKLAPIVEPRGELDLAAPPVSTQPVVRSGSSWSLPSSFGKRTLFSNLFSVMMCLLGLLSSALTLLLI